VLTAIDAASQAALDHLPPAWRRFKRTKPFWDPA